MARRIPKLGTDAATRENFLKDGPMTAQFLNDPNLDRSMARAKTDGDKIKILYRYIHTKKLFKHPVLMQDQFKNENRFSRNAEEIWNGKGFTGCTDYALVFASIARKYGIPTTFLATAEAECAQSLKNGENVGLHRGHSFCECFVDGKWVLVDPIKATTENEYDPENIVLTGRHHVGGRKNFIAYDRSLDTERRQTTKEYNEAMREGVSMEEPEAQVEPVTTSELETAGYEKEDEEIIINKEDNKNKEKQSSSEKV